MEPVSIVRIVIVKAPVTAPISTPTPAGTTRSGSGIPAPGSSSITTWRAGSRLWFWSLAIPWSWARTGSAPICAASRATAGMAALTPAVTVVFALTSVAVAGPVGLAVRGRLVVQVGVVVVAGLVHGHHAIRSGTAGSWTTSASAHTIFIRYVQLSVDRRFPAHFYLIKLEKTLRVAL